MTMSPEIRYHHHEATRLSVASSYGVEFERAQATLTALVESVARLTRAPYAALSTVEMDHQHQVIVVGGEPVDAPRQWSTCSDVVAGATALTIDDLRSYVRYENNPEILGAGLYAYAGVPVAGVAGLPFAVLCVRDDVPRRFDEADMHALQRIAVAIGAVLDQLKTAMVAAPTLDRPVDGGLDAPLPAEIVRAIDAGEMVPYYQPIVRTSDQRIVSFEALSRWCVPDGRIVSPAMFMPQITQSAVLSLLFTETVLNTAYAQVAQWRERFGAWVPVSVNVSGHDLSSGCLPSLMHAAAAAAGVPISSLHLELVETAGVTDRERAMKDLFTLSAEGVEIYLDDFGTGFSGLDYLDLFPVAGIKIDRTFITRMDRRPMRAAVASITQLASCLGISVTAEGIESEAQHELVRKEGISRSQGYLFGRPATGAQVSTTRALWAPHP